MGEHADSVLSPDELLAELSAAARPEELPARIARCRAVLAATSREEALGFWADLQETLGLLLTRLAVHGTAVEEAAIEAFEEAAAAFLEAGDREGWAGASANLANIYRTRQTDRTAGLYKALLLLEGALPELESEEMRIPRAQLLINLANVYSEIPEGEQTI
ncbi:MAG: hypothetical protein ABUT39_25980, partial [Acidobacteriota bacterium]